MNFLYFIILGAIAGWIAGKIMKGGGFGTGIEYYSGYYWRCRWRLGFWIAVLVPVTDS